MKVLLLIFSATAALASRAAFDEEAWLAKRARLTQEAYRLRAAYSNCAARVEVPAEEVSISIETFPDGKVKTGVTAKRAQFFLDSGLVWAEGIVLRRFKEDGSEDAELRAENCVIDRNSHALWIEGAATLAQGSNVFSGAAAFVSSRENYLKVFRSSSLESEDAKVAGGLR